MTSFAPLQRRALPGALELQGRRTAPPKRAVERGRGDITASLHVDEKSGPENERAGMTARGPTEIRIGRTDDPLEREADRAAEAIMSGASSPALRSRAEVAADHVQRSEARASPPVTPQLARALQQQVLRGRPLEGATRQFMESRFATRFPHVRVHDDGQAASFSQQLGARAFTWQNHIFFDRGEFSPDRPRGRRLIAHELSHVIQQSVPSERATIRRAVKFYDGVEDVRAKVVDERGEVRESSPLIDEFIAGLKQFFQIEAVKRESESGLHAAHAYIAVELAGEAPKLDEKALDAKIGKVFNGEGRLVVPRPRGPGEPHDGVKVEDDYAAIDAAALKERYLFVRDALIQRLKKGGLDVDVKHSTTDKGKSTAIRYEDPRGPVGEHIEVTPAEYRNIKIHKRSGWNGFWILVHEILHDAGLDDDESQNLVSSGYAHTAKQIDLREFSDVRKRIITSPDDLWTTIGDPEYALNMVRLVEGLPLRTGYADLADTSVRFSDFSGPRALGGRRVARSTNLPDGADFEYVGATMQGARKEARQKIYDMMAFWQPWQAADRLRVGVGTLAGTFAGEAARFSFVGLPGLPPETLIVEREGGRPPTYVAVSVSFVAEGEPRQPYGLEMDAGERGWLKVDAADPLKFAAMSGSGPVRMKGTIDGEVVEILLHTPSASLQPSSPKDEPVAPRSRRRRKRGGRRG